jgi:hypothetical protein
MKKLQLVEDWRKAWRWFSVNAMVLAAAIQGAWLQIPDDMKASIPPALVSYSTITLLVLGVLGRLLKQGGEGGSDEQRT